MSVLLVLLVVSYHARHSISEDGYVTVVIKGQTDETRVVQQYSHAGVYRIAIGIEMCECGIPFEWRDIVYLVVLN